MKMKIVNEPNIVQASPIKVDDGLMPYRHVIQYIPNDLYSTYVVYRENMRVKEVEPGVFEWTHTEFYWGHYYGSLKAAHENFESRK